MVMFTCNRCSAGLKKNQVETHAFRCGGVSKIDLTCHDCLKDFRGKEYESHTSCVSEEARYGGKNVVVKETGKKQNLWCEVVQNVLANNKKLEPDVYKFLKSAVNFSNIPRKKKPFVNWTRNVMKWADNNLIDKVFDVLETEFHSNNKTTDQRKSQNGSTEKEQSDAENGIDVKGAGGKVDPGQNEINENDANDGSSKKKEKNKKRKNSETAEGADHDMNGGEKTANDSTDNGVGETCENGKSLKKKKKKNKGSTEVTEETSQSVDSVTDDISQNEIHENGDRKDKKKKKKKSADVSISEEPMEVEGTSDEPAENAKPAEDQEKSQKLSKKDRKLLKKKAKFEAEVAEIENFRVEEEEKEEVVEEEKPKKSKKRKNEEETDLKDDGAKKQKVENEQDPAEEPKKVKFNWFDTILTVLRKSKNDEVPVKKVTKLVINEYLSQYGDKGIQDKLHVKMNKKLRTCPGIRVLKDKVKLVESDR